MGDVMALVGGAIETVKKLREVSEKIKNAETRNLIGDLSLSLADLKAEIASLKEENLQLKEQLKQKQAKDSYSEMIVKDNVLYFAVAPPGKSVGPYCPNCKENGNKLVLIQDLRNSTFSGFGNFRCNACKSHF